MRRRITVMPNITATSRKAMSNLGYTNSLDDLIFGHALRNRVETLLCQYLLPLHDAILIVDVNKVRVATRRASWKMKYLHSLCGIFTFW